ncbi:MAG: DUF2007 domain-containing protein [Bacteroidales bacterium]|nr:DUF2007 domain-containing protein [Bacteroidales bacterium]
MEKEVHPVEVFAGTSAQATIVKSILESAGIYCFLKDDIMGTLFPWYTSAGGAGAVKVFVSDADFEEAKAIVEEYEKNIQ